MVEKQFEVQQKAKDLLKERGVEVKDIAELVYFLQTKYIEHLTMETCLHNVEKVLQKREVQHAVLTGIQLDIFAEKEKMMDLCKILFIVMKGFMALMKCLHSLLLIFTDQLVLRITVMST